MISVVHRENVKIRIRGASGIRLAFPRSINKRIRTISDNLLGMYVPVASWYA